MPTKPNTQQARNKDTEQYILNDSFDPEFKILAVEMVGYDGTNLQRLKVGSDGSLVTGGSSTYTTRVDDAGSLITYVGKAEIASATSSAVWQIQKIDETGGDLVITWADGNASFDNVWDDRASLTYN